MTEVADLDHCPRCAAIWRHPDRPGTRLIAVIQNGEATHRQCPDCGALFKT